MDIPAINPSSVTTSVLPYPHIGTAVQCNNGIHTTDTWISKTGSFYMVQNDQGGNVNFIADAYSFVPGQDPYFNIQKLMIMSLPLFCSPKMSSARIIYPTSNGKVPTIQCDRANNASRHVIQLWVQANKNSYSVVYQFGTTYTSLKSPVIESNYDFIPGQDPLVNAQEAWLRLAVLACSSDYATLKFLTPVTEAIDNSYLQCDRADDSFKSRFALLWAASITSIQHQVYIQDSSTSSDNRTIGNTEGGDGEDPKFDALKIRDLWADLLCSGDYQVFELLPTNVSAPICESLLPCTDNTYDVGAPGDRWRNIYAGTSISTPLLVLNAVSYTTMVISVSGTAGQISISGTSQNPIVGLVNVGTPGTCSNPSSLTTDPQGRVPTCTSGPAPVLSVTGVSGDITCTAGQNPICDLVNVGTPGTCSNPSSLNTDSKGRVTTCTSGAAPVLSVTGVSGDITCTAGQNPVCDLVSVVAPATCNNPDQIIFDAKGRVTSCTNGGTGTTVTTVTGTPFEITATGTNHVVLSIPSEFVPPGNVRIPQYLAVGFGTTGSFPTATGDITGHALALNPPNPTLCGGQVLDIHAIQSAESTTCGTFGDAAGKLYNRLQPTPINNAPVNYTSWELFTFLGSGVANTNYSRTVTSTESYVLLDSDFTSATHTIGLRAGLANNLALLDSATILLAEGVVGQIDWFSSDSASIVPIIDQWNAFSALHPSLDLTAAQPPIIQTFIAYNCGPLDYHSTVVNSCFKAVLPTNAPSNPIIWLASDTVSAYNGIIWGSNPASPKTNLYLYSSTGLRTDKDFTVGGALTTIGVTTAEGDLDALSNIHCLGDEFISGYLTVGTGVNTAIFRQPGSIEAASIALGDQGQNEFFNISTAQCFFVNQTLPETSGVAVAGYIYATIDPPAATTAAYDALVITARTIFNNVQNLGTIGALTVNAIHDGVSSSAGTSSVTKIIALNVNAQFGSWNAAGVAQSVYGVHSMLMPVTGLTGVTGTITLYSAFRTESPTFQSITNTYSIGFDCGGWMGGAVASCFRVGAITSGTQKFGFHFQTATAATWNGISWTDGSGPPVNVLANWYLGGTNLIKNDFDIAYRHHGSKSVIGTCTVSTGAGTGATCSVVGSDHGGILTVNTGTLPQLSAAVVTVNFGTSWASTGLLPSACVITGATPAAINAPVYMAVLTTSGFSLATGATFPLTASSLYQWYYVVTGK
jgi:hypothetical protein